MTGIAGFVTQDEIIGRSSSLPALMESLPQKENQTSSTYITRFCQFGCVDGSYTGQPALVKKKHVALAWMGTIARDETLAQRLKCIPDLAANQTLAGYLADLFLHEGTNALRSLNGQYVIVVWDEQKQALAIINDRYGLQPFYYACTGERLVFASSMSAIIHLPGFPKRLNPVALFDLLAAGQMLGERTLFQDIQALPPAAELAFSGGRLTISRYWQPALYQAGAPSQPLETYGKPYGDLIQAAVGRHTRPESCLLLTGGLDSRWLAGSLVTLYGSQEIQANTIGHDRSRDTRLAMKIAQALEIHYQVIPVNPNYLAEYAQECVRRTEGNMNISAAWILGEAGFLHSRGIHQIVTGVGAELISGRHWLVEHPDVDPNTALQQYCTHHWQFEPAARLMRPPYRKEAPDASLDLLKQCLRAAPSDDLLSQYDYMNLVQNRRHPTGNILAADAAVQEPFFDNDLVDFAYRVPPRMRSMLHKIELAKRYPELAGIETTDRSEPVLGGNHSMQKRIRQAENILFRTTRKLRLARAAGLPEGDPPWGVIYPNHWLRTKSRAFLTQFTGKLDRLEPWVDSSSARQLFEDHLAGRIHAYASISALITAMIWMEQMM